MNQLYAVRLLLFNKKPQLRGFFTSNCDQNVVGLAMDLITAMKPR